MNEAIVSLVTIILMFSMSSMFALVKFLEFTTGIHCCSHYFPGMMPIYITIMVFELLGFLMGIRIGNIDTKVSRREY